jgi:hypothetical protein
MFLTGTSLAMTETMKESMIPHWVVIVHEENPEVAARLRQTYRTLSLVEIVLDRRQRERRRAPSLLGSERRGRDRRRATASRPQVTGASHRLVQRTAAYDVYEAESVVHAECPRCDAHLEVEMPRFGELPARIDLDVFHTLSHAHGVKHFVEAQAFRATGRSILACRLLARSTSLNGHGQAGRRLELALSPAR